MMECFKVVNKLDKHIYHVSNADIGIQIIALHCAEAVDSEEIRISLLRLLFVFCKAAIDFVCNHFPQVFIVCTCQGGGGGKFSFYLYL